MKQTDFPPYRMPWPERWEALTGIRPRVQKCKLSRFPGQFTYKFLDGNGEPQLTARLASEIIRRTKDGKPYKYARNVDDKPADSSIPDMDIADAKHRRLAARF